MSNNTLSSLVFPTLHRYRLNDYMINRNMGCIEIELLSAQLLESCRINRRMGCIEIKEKERRRQV